MVIVVVSGLAVWIVVVGYNWDQLLENMTNGIMSRFGYRCKGHIYFRIIFLYNLEFFYIVRSFHVHIMHVGKMCRYDQVEYKTEK